MAILAVVALALDGGLLVDKRRQAQSAADAAALAAANDLFKNWFMTASAYGYQYQGLDPSGSARRAALAAAAANGFADGIDGCTVTVNIPPKSGPFARKAGHTEVIISTSQQRYFSRVFGGSSNVTYGARVVSRGRRGGINNAIICLNPTGKGSLNAAGNGTITVVGAPVQVNSNNYSAMIANGNGFMKADQFLVTGSPGYTTPGGGVVRAVTPPAPPRHLLKLARESAWPRGQVPLSAPPPPCRILFPTWPPPTRTGEPPSAAYPFEG